ncbi:MAG: hypothetical protein ABH952_00795 [Candidatus Omnitrophota bacterium]
MNLKNNQGAIYLIAVFLILVSSILVIGFLEVAATDIEISRNHKSDVIATYIADAGIEDAIYDLLGGGGGDISRTEFPDTADNNTYYTVVQTDVSGSDYTLESTGEYGDFQRVIEAVIRVSGTSATVRSWKEL